MKAIRINTTIDSSIIRFDEVKNLEGKKAEIIILVEDSEEIPYKKAYSAAGSLKQYADVDKVAEEKTAYEKHVKDK